MSCFDDLMQFRDDVEDAMKKTPTRSAAKRLEDPAKLEEKKSKLTQNIS
jgi:hypothetical protein